MYCSIFKIKTQSIHTPARLRLSNNLNANVILAFWPDKQSLLECDGKSLRGVKGYSDGSEAFLPQRFEFNHPRRITKTSVKTFQKSGQLLYRDLIGVMTINLFFFLLFFCHLISIFILFTEIKKSFLFFNFGFISWEKPLLNCNKSILISPRNLNEYSGINMFYKTI